MIYLNFKNARLECVEFNCYFDDVENDLRSEIDLLVEADVDGIEEICSDPFLIEMEHHTYIFSGYKLWEYYKVGDLVKLIFIK